MTIPASPCFSAVDLTAFFNADRESLPETLRFHEPAAWTCGPQSLRGMPFVLGQLGAPNVIYLERTPVMLAVGALRASYLMFLHAVEDRLSGEMPSFTDNGNALGDHVSDYVLEYADGTTTVVAIRLRAMPAHSAAWPTV
jgi:hypothetical protein